jgi:NAD(P)-dependent dehydrogenase (short-subunit alcohol dehydrogenase family)
VTGRNDPGLDEVNFIPLHIDEDAPSLIAHIDALVRQVGAVHTLIYAAGFYQEGRIDELTDREILTMIHVGITAPTLLINRFKNNLGKPLKVILITSSSQYTPRQLEPLYTMAKAGLGMLGRSLALDEGLGKVMVIAPSGMLTPFWNNEKDTTTYLDPSWAAQQIVELSTGPFKYKFAKLLRDPARVLIEETA